MNANNVILIGANNYNGLGLVRSFGRHKIFPYGIIVGRDSYNGYLEKSKYWKKTWHVDDAEDVIPCLLSNFTNTQDKPIVISYVDKVTQLLDNLYDKLSERFILPSISHRQGAITALANKECQAVFAESIGFDSLKTTIVPISDNICSDNLKYPVILKPVSGGEGDKHDITICSTQEEYIYALKAFATKNYSRILLQPYLEERQEYVVLGAVSSDTNLISYTVLKNIRQWPESFGVGCFSEYVTDDTDPELLHFVNKLFLALAAIGYDSPIDIELFKDGTGKIYINEFNWRVSGRNFTALDTGVYSVVWWYMTKTGMSLEGKPMINTKCGYTMKETEDIKNVIFKKIKFSKWFSDYRKTHSFGIFDRHDWKPVFSQYWKLIKSFFKR